MCVLVHQAAQNTSVWVVLHTENKFITIVEARSSKVEALSGISVCWVCVSGTINSYPLTVYLHNERTKRAVWDLTLSLSLSFLNPIHGAELTNHPENNLPKILPPNTILVAQGWRINIDAGDVGLILGQEDPWRRKWQPTPVFLPGEFHGQRSLAD